MTVDIITLFPDMFKGPFDMSMMLKARDKGLLKLTFHDLREYGLGTRRTVDDTPYGGGDGMLLNPEPVVAAIEAVKALRPGARVIVMTPGGAPFTQNLAQELSELSGIILLAGHYEGYDERIMDYVDAQISIGDYVLTGGELPAMVITDAVARLIPGVLGGEQSAIDETFSHGLLEYPQYTRPLEFRGKRVPDVLQQGNHGAIATWRHEQSLEKTREVRPDLLR